MARISTFSCAFAVSFALSAFSCSANSQWPAGRDPQRLSESKYDLARDLWLRQHKPREALAEALEAVKLDKNNADAAHLVALIYLDFCQRSVDECRLDQAEKHARLALAARPDFREAKNTLGVILVHAKRPAEAALVLEPLTRDMLYQTPENAWGNLGWAYLELGRLDRAIDALRRSVAVEPLFCVGHYRLGLAHERSRELVPAYEAFDRALKVKGCERLQEAWAGRGRVGLKLGRADTARADLEHCAALDARSKIGKDCRSMLSKLK